MDIYFATRHGPSPRAAFHMKTPVHEFLGIFEAGGTDVEPLEDRLLGLLVLVLFVAVAGVAGMGFGSPVIAFAGTRKVAQQLLSIVARVPRTKEQVSKSDLINVPVCSRRW
jgi:hypothetical protein